MSLDLVQEMNEKIKELSTSIKVLKDHGIKFAQAEMEYKIAVTSEVLKLRDGGMPVTMISLVVYGQKDVATKRFARDVAEAMYNANQEHINVTKLQLKIIENQIQREYYDK